MQVKQAAKEYKSTHSLVYSCQYHVIFCPKYRRTLRKEFPVLKSRLPRLWTQGKSISSVGAVTLEVVKKYIEEQKGV